MRLTTMTPSRELDDYGSFLTVSEAAAVLRIGRATAYEYLRAGLLPELRIGRRVVVPKAALERMTAEATDDARL
jgi:excisionase family DNA binding protein